MPGSTFLRVSIAAAIALGAIGCSASGGGPGLPSSSLTDPPRSQASPDRGEGGSPGARVAEVLRFTAPRLGGGRIDGEDYSGRDTAFWFWAPW